MTPEAKADLLRAVTDFYEVVRRCLGEAEADQGEREAVFDFVHAVHDASTELIRKLRPNSTQH